MLNFNSIGGALDAMNVNAVGGLDLVGYDDVIGADEDVVDFLGIGAAPAGGARGRALQKMQRGKQIVQVNPQQARMLQMGGFFTQGAAAGIGEITIKSQEPVRPQRLVLGGANQDGTALVLAAIIILDIKVGTRSQLTANGGIPANMFAGDATVQMAGFQYDTVQPGCDMVITFRSIPANATVSAGVMVMTLR